jgi:acyl-coenzyme A thioesterase PaaI-like protein
VQAPESDSAGSRREGPFWDVMEGRREPPPAAVTLGFQLVAIDPEAGTIEVAFNATERFLNPAGHVQGGFLAAMLDDTLGPALVATLPPGHWAPTIDLQVQFLTRRGPGSCGGLAGSCAEGATSRSWRASCAAPTGRWSPPRRPRRS